jgi:hypothetical protein
MQMNLQSRSPLFAINWTPRKVPLPPEGVAARGDVALRLAQRLLQLTDETLGKLLGVAGEKLLVITGAPDLLPWVDGVQYLGTEPEDATLLSPTNYVPSVPYPLLARALKAKLKTSGPYAVLPYPALLVPLLSARSITREALTAWLERQ